MAAWPLYVEGVRRKAHPSDRRQMPFTVHAADGIFTYLEAKLRWSAKNSKETGPTPPSFHRFLASFFKFMHA